jgi:predicted nucleic acid-binding protein
LAGRKLPTVSTLTLLDLAFGIATTFDRTLYDSLYVALAVQGKGELITPTSAWPMLSPRICP